MEHLHLTAKKLYYRYRQGERNFSGVNLNGESLRGMNLRGINLSEANLSHTDLRGTNFTNAKLIGANLCGVKSGTLRRWALPKVLVASMFIVTAGMFAAALWSTCAVLVFHPNGSYPATKTVNGDIITGLAGLATLVGILFLTCSRGLLSTLGIIFPVVASAIVISVSVSATKGDADFGIAALSVGAIAAFVIVIGTFSILFTFAADVASTVAVAIAGSRSTSIAFVFTFALTFLLVGFIFSIDKSVAFTGSTAVATIFAGIGASVTLLISYLISCRALRGDPRDHLVFTVTSWFIGWGGTQFRGADLTRADFSKATLKSAHFHNTILTHTRFHLVRKVNLARLSKTILADFAVQELLTTLRGRDKIYTSKNLKGANLAGADLTGADFTEADLSQANLEGADLQGVNFTKTQALGAQFRQANLTGACLEAWNIDSTTKLTGVMCEYVYLLNHQEERRPNSGNFHPGEFTKLFEEVLDTIDLIFREGIDWKAFLQTFQKVQREHQASDLGIQSIENKGDGVVVVKLHAIPDTDKESVHQSFMSGYQIALKEAEARYKAQLYAKEEQIQDYRQQNANMQEVVKLLASRPINIDVKATAESKAMQGNDQSQKFNVQGDFTINAQNSVVSLRDISGQVSNQISQLSTNSTSDQPSLKDLLTELQQAVETDVELGDSEKAEALAEVGELASAAQNPKEGVMQKAAKGAMNALKGIAAGLSDASKLAVACKDLLPLLKTIFGLP